MNKRVLRFFLAIISTSVSFGVLSKSMIYKCKNAGGGYSYQKAACNEGDDTVDSWTPKIAPPPVEPAAEADKANAEKKSEPVVLKLKQNAAGHYETDGKINEKALNFVVDTGASLVTLPEETAHNAQIYCDDKIKVDTANGVADSCTTKIGKLQFGSFVIKDVPALIQSNLSQPLLGMNVLQHFKIEQNNGEMSLSYLRKNQPEKSE